MIVFLLLRVIVYLQYTHTFGKLAYVMADFCIVFATAGFFMAV